MGRYIVLAPSSPSSFLGAFSAKGAWEAEASRRSGDATHQRLNEYLDRSCEVAVKAPADSLDVVGATAVEMDAAEASRLCDEHPGVSVVEDREIPLISPQLTSETGATQPPDRWHLDALGVEQARAEGRVGRGAGVRIALFDSGIEATHPEFAVDAVEQVVLEGEEVVAVTPFDGDDEGHGTHTAGLAGGATVGVAPEAKLLSLQAIENRSTQLSDLLVRWIRYLVQRQDVDIASFSIGLPTTLFADEPAAVVALETSFGLLRRNDILPVVAIGNDGRHRVRYPGALPEALAVGATTRTERVWSSSSSGAMQTGGVVVPLPDLVAPGAGVYSSVPGDLYRPAWGTSQATPLVAGLAALLRERDESLMAEDLQDELLNSCRPLASAGADRQGAGILSI